RILPASYGSARPSLKRGSGRDLEVLDGSRESVLLAGQRLDRLEEGADADVLMRPLIPEDEAEAPALLDPACRDDEAVDVRAQQDLGDDRSDRRARGGFPPASEAGKKNRSASLPA